MFQLQIMSCYMFSTVWLKLGIRVMIFYNLPVEVFVWILLMSNDTSIRSAWNSVSFKLLQGPPRLLCQRSLAVDHSGLTYGPDILYVYKPASLSSSLCASQDNLPLGSSLTLWPWSWTF